MNEQSYMKIMNNEIMKLVKTAIKISVKNPSFSPFIVKNLLWQKKAEKLRNNFSQEGYQIPPFLIASVTSRCNLRCKGCYDQAQHEKQKNELSTQKWVDIFSEGKALGVTFILIAGGEPFMRKDLLMRLGDFPEIIFPVFTNGTHFDEEILHNLEKNKNIIPVISLEGYENDTDDRRGTGVYQKVLNALSACQNNHIFFGISITITSENYELVTSTQFVKDYTQKGCQLLFYVEYIPFDDGTKHLEITQEQREALIERLLVLGEDFSALFISFPGDENKLGGCLSSGRGFAHISASGDLEPCPFSPYSDVNLNEAKLKDALQSQFLKSIRENDEHLSDTTNGCALFHKKDWVKSLLNK